VLQHPQQCSMYDPFLTSKFSYPLFCNLTHKTGTANRWVTNMLVPYGQISDGCRCQIILSTLLWQVHSFVCLSSQTILLRQTRHKPACFDFSSSNFNVQGHILNTTVEALSDLYRKLHEMVGYLTNYQCYSIPVCHCH
jgi:hypothetical protein